MPSEAETSLSIAKRYLDSITKDVLSKAFAPDERYGLLGTVAAATKHLDRARQLDPKCVLEIKDEKTHLTTTRTLDELCADALYYEGVGHAFGSFEYDVEKSIPVYQKALVYRPLDPQTHTQLGWALMRLERSEEARRHLTEAIRIDPNYMRAHELLDGASIPPPVFKTEPTSFLRLLGDWFLRFCAFFVKD